MTHGYLTRRFWYVLLFLLAAYSAHGQYTASGGGVASTVGQIIPPAPKTAALGTFGQQPVDLNTGAVTVSVPLLELQSGPLHLPLALHYSTSGIKVAQVPSWVGQGWSLPAAGVITRTVRGRLDEEQGVGYTTKWPVWRRADSLAAVNAPGARARKHALDRQAYNENWDLEADTYNVAAPGLSATLTDLGYGKALLTPDQGWQVISGGPEVNVWELAAPDGTHYYFGQLEISETENETGRHTFISAWHLTTIESADRHYRLEFDYVLDGDAVQINLPQVTKVKCVLPGSRVILPEMPGADPCVACLQDPPSTGQLGTVYQPVVPVWLHTVSLRQISSATQRVVFDSDLLSQPVAAGQIGPQDPPARVLRQLRIFAQHGDGLPARTFRFAYHYSGSSTAPPDSITQAGRFFLLAAGEAGKPATRFTYNSLDLPSVHSFSQDHWGFFNGAINRSLVPQLPLEYKYQLFEGGDRATHPRYLLAGSLSSVTYPTGGSTYFTYEANQVRTSRLFDVDEPGGGEQRVALRAVANGSTYLDSLSQHAYDVLYGSGYSGLGKPYVSASLLKLPDGARSLSWSIDSHDPPNPNPGSTDPNAPGGGVLTTAPPDIRLVQVDMTAVDPVADALHAASDIYPPYQPLTLPPGTYLALAVAFDSAASASLSVSMLPHLNAPDVLTRTVGGLRIRRMVDYPNLGRGDSLVTTYDYTMPDPLTGQPISSGVLFDTPTYIKFTPCGALVVTTHDNTLLPRPGAESYHVGYAQVTTTRQRAATGGTTRTTYLNADDPLARNLVTSEAHFDATGRLVQATQTDYALAAPVRRPSAKLELFSFETVMSADPGGGCQQIVRDTLFNSPLYYFETLQIQTPRVQQRHYEASTNHYQEQLSWNRYAPDAYGRFRPVPTETSRVTSTGDTVLTWRRFTADVDTTYLTPGSNPAARGVAALLARGATGLPVEERQGRATAQGRYWLSGTWTDYGPTRQPARHWSLRAAQPLPAATLPWQGLVAGSLLPPSSYEPTLSYDQYSERGELVQLHTRSGLATSLLWGNHFPLAQALNQPAGVGASTSFEPRSYGGWRCDSGATSTHLVRGGRPGGRWAYQLTGTAPVRSLVQPAHAYVLEYWAQGDTPTLYQDQLPLTPLSRVVVATAPGGWHQDRVRVRLDTPATLALDGSAILLDEVRLFWPEAQLTSYTYDPLFGNITAQTGPDGRTITYEYDALGRLLRTRDEQGRILSQQQYHYAGQR